MDVNDDIRASVKEYILKEFLPGEDPNELTDSTPLITGGILDSIATLKLVLFVEEKFGVTLEAHDTDAEHLNTLKDIEQLIRSKKK
jgi:acyl carrier protein